MIDTQDYRALLSAYAHDYDLALDEEQCHLMLRHLDLLVETNKRVNLTRIVEPEDAIVRHVVDSLLFVPSIQSLGSSAKERFVDIGTGGGFPGIPLSIATGMSGTLIDSVGKKVTAVQSFVNELGLNERLEARAVRAEELSHDCPGSYQFVVARAVASLGALVEYAAPLLAKQGHLIVSKGNISPEETEVGTKTADLVGLRMVSRETYELPHEMGHREVLTFEKVRKSRVKLPRQAGAAVHKPLVGEKKN